MRYQEGTYGRIFLLRFDDGDDLLEEIRSLAARENVRAATVTLLGGMRTASVVSGPREGAATPSWGASGRMPWSTWSSKRSSPK